MSKNDGGNAFPTVEGKSDHGVEYLEYSDGMTLRDYFASKAMQSLIIAGWSIDEVTTSRSYFMADAMIIQRDK